MMKKLIDYDYIKSFRNLFVNFDRIILKLTYTFISYSQKNFGFSKK